MGHIALIDPATLGLGASAFAFALTAIMSLAVLGTAAPVRGHMRSLDGRDGAGLPCGSARAAGLAGQWRRLGERIDDGIARSRAAGAFHGQAREQLDSAAFALDRLRAEFSDIFPADQGETAAAMPKAEARPKPRPKRTRRTGQRKRRAGRTGARRARRSARNAA